MSPDKTEIGISTLCPGAITKELIIKAIKDKKIAINYYQGWILGF